MIFTLNADQRHTVKKSDLTNLRADGKIPAIIYGPSMPGLSISINKAEFTQLFKKSFTEVCFWEIACEGKKYHTLLKEKQIHPVTRNFLHLDFLMVDADDLIEFDVPIRFIGEAVGTKEGGMLDAQQHTVKITCKAANIPEDLKLDVTNLKVGDSLHVSDLPKGNWQYKDHNDVTLVVVHPKKSEAVKDAAPTTETEK
ncbi:MAG: 50S ribosomal protein L25 [Candidatus Cloacimonetes bacterium]|nr:50S ribosomal protein L25 [Candidatus Cloacimonadota bacterium]